MQICNTILDAIGNTPLVRLNRVTAGVPATVLAKVETFNPGNSIKDRMALKMIEDAEKSGKLKPGGTIIEGTSGQGSARNPIHPRRPPGDPDGVPWPARHQSGLMRLRVRCLPRRVPERSLS